MSLAAAGAIARQSLASLAIASSVISRNVANVDDPSAARKSTLVTSSATGDIKQTSIVGAANSALFERAVAANASHAALERMGVALTELASIMGDATSPIALPIKISELQNKLQIAASVPHDQIALRQAVMAANTLAENLQSAFSLIDRLRQDTDAELRRDTERLGELLRKFGQANKAVMFGAARAADMTDAIDQRHALVRGISDLVHVRPVIRPPNDMMLFLGNGATLFETSERQVTISSPPSLLPGQSGIPLRIDGADVATPSSLGGKIGGLLEIRDGIARQAGLQLDEIARGLIAATVEIDQSPTPTLEPVAGLFIDPSSTSPPTDVATKHGISGRITINPRVDPSRGGDPSRLRDGGIGVPNVNDYVYNKLGHVGFNLRLLEIKDALNKSQPFAPETGLAPAQGGVLALAVHAAGWIENERSNILQRTEGHRIASERALSGWQNIVGVNIDEEMAEMISLQRSYQASARMLVAIDEMFGHLLTATR